MDPYGSAAPVRPIELLAQRNHQVPTCAAGSCATALENWHLRVAVGVCRLYFETGHRCRDFLIARMAGTGRVCEVTNDRFVEAKLEKPAPGIGQLWRSLAGGYGSTSAGRPRELTAGKLTAKLSPRIADIRGRQWTTLS